MSEKWTKSRVENRAADRWPRREIRTARTPGSGGGELYRSVTSEFGALIGAVAGAVAWRLAAQLRDQRSREAR
jgi:hypothetical protein